MKKAGKSKGKTTKSATTFRTNKPNSPIVQLDLTLFTTMYYAISACLTKVKNKPNSNPIASKAKNERKYLLYCRL